MVRKPYPNNRIAFYFAQNCFSYALESYFKNAKIANNFFNQYTNLKTDGMEKVLKSTFKLVQKFKTKPRRNLRKPLPDHVIVTFRNNWGGLQHAFYHHKGKFYSKNGMHKPIVVNSLKAIYKYYWDAQYVEVYQLDLQKVKQYLNK